MWVTIGLSRKITKIRTPVLVSYPKQVWNSLKQVFPFCRDGTSRSAMFVPYVRLKAPCTGTINPKGIVRFRSCNKAVANVFPKAEPCSAIRTGQYFLD